MKTYLLKSSWNEYIETDLKSRKMLQTSVNHFLSEQNTELKMS